MANRQPVDPETADYTAAMRGAITLWLLLQAGSHGMTAVTLCRALGVSRRYAFRLLRDLSALHGEIPPIYNDLGRWHIRLPID